MNTSSELRVKSSELRVESSAVELPTPNSQLSTRQGFSLLEVLSAVVIIGILASIAMPIYRRAIEREHWRRAGDLLLTIYHGERAFFFVNNTYLAPATPAEWRRIHMDNPELGTPPPVTYAVVASPVAFTATATRNVGPCSGQTLTIDETRAFTPDPSTTVCWPGCGCG